MTIGDLLKKGTTELAKSGILNASSDAILIIAHALNEDKSYVLAHNHDELSSPHCKRILNLFELRAKRLPMSYVLGTKEFFGLNFKIDKRALTPRTETEIIVEEIIKRAPKKARLLDIGTGTGAMAIAIKYHRPDLNVTASEVSATALSLARENAQKLLSKESPIALIESDLFTNIAERFDCIVANLPYVSRSTELMPEVEAEPAVALFGGDTDGLMLYRRFFSELPSYLKTTGQVWIESDPWQQPALIKLAQNANLSVIFQDYFIIGFEVTAKSKN
ncbi:peptide chain release factor N(5)-glutamine methyltransferase [Candidatus Saccharibacteria bacterium]|nr:peptide chain release factor N(5)-glutamine methyltransferase [Candidatus Saccharibacteria bacterium]